MRDRLARLLALAFIPWGAFIDWERKTHDWSAPDLTFDETEN